MCSGAASGSAPTQPRIELGEEPVNLSVQEALSILRFDPAFRAYALEWRFRHPTGAQLERIMIDTIVAPFSKATSKLAADGTTMGMVLSVWACAALAAANIAATSARRVME